LTPPASSTASPDRAAARRGLPRETPATSGTSTHGASAPGQTSMLIAPTCESGRAASA
jgi:hypothetical protein